MNWIFCNRYFLFITHLTGRELGWSQVVMVTQPAGWVILGYTRVTTVKTNSYNEVIRS